MVSLAICFLSSVNKIICKPQTYFTHALNLPYPKILHKQLDSAYLEKFEEVLIIGDVHGCYDELVMLLEKADALRDSTLKIFVGDIVNKGPKSKDVINFLRNSTSMLSVRGNHDEVVIKEHIESKNSNYNMKPNNSWIKNLTYDEIEYLTELPFTISLPSLNAIIVHAGLIPGLPLQNNNPYDMVCMRNIVEADYFWEGGFRGTKYTKEGEPWASMWNGPQHVYFGHDAKRMLQNYAFATGLDTGCVYGNYLTGCFISGPKKGLFVNIKALKVYTKPKGLD